MSILAFAREAVESMYHGTCDIFTMQDVKDETTKKTKQAPVKSNTDPIQCKLSFSAGSTAMKKKTETYEKQQKIEVFMAPEIIVAAGSTLVITQDGVSGTYKNSGVPAIYETHQEIILEKDGEWT